MAGLKSGSNPVDILLGYALISQDYCSSCTDWRVMEGVQQDAT